MQPSREISGRQRLLVALAAVVLAGLLVTAACLPPSERGYGTHQQLGLPPCSFTVLFGYRCPTCGMTTAWSHLVRGHVIEAVAANAGGFLACVLAIVAAPWLAWAAIRERWPRGTPGGEALAWIIAGIIGVALVQWGVRLAGT